MNREKEIELKLLKFLLSNEPDKKGVKNQSKQMTDCLSVDERLEYASLLRARGEVIGAEFLEKNICGKKNFK